MTTSGTLAVRKLRPSDLARLSTVGLRTRKLRAALSALGIAIGVAAIVAVLGLSSSASANLNNEISALGTNLLVVKNGQTITGGSAELPKTARAMIARIVAVTHVEQTGSVSGDVYRNSLIPSIDTNDLSIDAASLGLLRTVGTSIAQGRYLNAATANEPVAVLGAAAAQRLGIDRVYSGERIWADNTWLYVAGILNPAVLALADGVERLAQVTKDMELVEQDGRLRGVMASRGTKRLPHVHHRQANFLGFYRAEPGVEFVEAGFRTVHAAKPNRPAFEDVADDDAILVPLAR